MLCSQSCSLDGSISNDAAAAGEASPSQEAGSKGNQPSPLTSPMGRLGICSPDAQGRPDNKVALLYPCVDFQSLFCWYPSLAVLLLLCGRVSSPIAYAPAVKTMLYLSA